MRRILERGSPFTAFIASNDHSCLGAIEALREAGVRVPEDVAAIGFDDVLDARSSTPSLTTVRHPTFTLGYRAVETTLDLIEGKAPALPVVVPTRLIVRQSCGCGRDGGAPNVVVAGGSRNRRPSELSSPSTLMAQAAYVEARQSTLDELEDQCRSFMTCLSDSLDRADPGPLSDEVTRLLAATHLRGEDPHVWQAAISALYGCADSLIDAGKGIDERTLMGLLDRVRLDIDEHVQKETDRARIAHMDMLSELGLLTSRLLSAGDDVQIAQILATHLPRLGIDQFLVALYRNGQDEDDPVGRSEILINLGLRERTEPFVSRSFPPRGLYPGNEPWQALLLPVRLGDTTAGFAAMSTANLEPSAAIVSNLGAAIRATELYQEALEGRRLAEEANQLKSRFLSMVSHELRTPLSMVVGLSDMVLRDTREGGVLSISAQRDLDQMSASAQHLGRLISDVLDLASSQAGQLHLVRQPLDLSEVLLDATLAGEQMARQKGLEWRARLPASGAWVLGDRTRLRQVVLNLLGNAVKFTDTGSVALEAEVANGEVKVSVSDTGVGVRAEELGSVFDEFHRAPEAVRQGLGGMGLGLAIARQLVQRHGGAIGVQSPGATGLGSTFWFTLPLVSAEAVGGAERDGRPSVLLVKAVETHDGWLEDYLSERGFAVRAEYVDPESDWSDVFEPLTPAALILDGGVAAGRGWEIVRLGKRRGELQRIPVLACRLEPSGELGAFLELTYLLKPLEAAELADELARLGPTPSGPAARPTVLVVDDGPGILDLYARAIHHAGAQPLRAGNGREAMTLMEESRPDLVLLDLAMPEMDGFQVLEAMRANRATHDIPVIVVTGGDVSDGDLDRLNHNVATILSKGVFTVQEIAGRIEAVLSNPPALGAATQRLVRQAIAYIEARYAEPIRREDIARQVSISPDYLTDCFHQELGMTPIAFLNRYRIRKARELLDTTDLMVTEIAMATGFSGVSYFTRTFHRAVGISPRAYRRGGRAQPTRVGRSA
jgi:signal transduction histidine kinase/AraC-like DNA-binding protein